MTKKLMVVAHPDDETLWGWRAFASGPWIVVCVTDCGLERQKRFDDVVRGFGSTSVTLGLRDGASNDLSSESENFIYQELNSILQRESVEIVVTHGPEGEYGHPMHKHVSRIVTSLVPPEKLCFFSFQDKPPPCI